MSMIWVGGSMRETSLVRLICVLAATLVLTGCSGGGGGGGGADAPGGSQVAIAGVISFDRLDFSAGSGGGLDAASPVRSPARGVQVEAIAVGTGRVLASAVTDDTGAYSLDVASGSNVFMRAKARMERTGQAPSWRFSVLNNTNRNALYVLDGTRFTVDAGQTRRDLHAASGWDGTGYRDVRAAAPFAILDTIYQARELILQGATAAAFPELNLYWSPDNRTAGFCPSLGNISTSFYVDEGLQDSCDVPGPVPAGIYLLGDYGNGSGDTDEFDQHVIAHEFAHYLEERFSRTDSLGGEHGSDDLLDLRVAFSEGLGNAFAGMTVLDPVYRDSFNGVSRDFGFDLARDEAAVPGWFSEGSVGRVLWELFDDGSLPASGTRGLGLGFAPLFTALTGGHADTDAVTSIFSFTAALRRARPEASADVTALLSTHGMTGRDDFATGETNSGRGAGRLPLFTPLMLGQPLTGVCSQALAGSADLNRLGNRVLLRFDNDRRRLITLQATGQAQAGAVAATDPDIYVLRRGQVVMAGESGEAGREILTSRWLDPGVYVIEVHDFDLPGSAQTPRCMTVTLSGN